MVDPLSEWFPVFTGRTSITTIQGHEWTSGQNLQASVIMNDRLQACLNQDLSCLASWIYDYVYIRKIKPMREGNIEPRYSILDSSLRASQKYQIVFENDEAIIYQPAR